MQASLSLIVAFAIFFSQGLSLKDDPLVVSIAQGQLKGRYGLTQSGRKFAEFLAVPYAKPPRRFQPSERPNNWTGIRNATEYGSKCGQFRAPNYLMGSENCLFVNIHTPALKNRNVALPVIVFLHGGAFQNGGFWAEFGPEYLMEADVVYVSVNYRLGALGFLSTGDGLASGNNGLKDQVMALRFIQENIAAFGGDPTRVALIGESAGAAAVSYHLLSPMSKGLFSSAISLSGSALCPWAIARRPLETFNKLAALVNCTQNSTAETLTCLENVPFEIILRNQALTKWAYDPIAAFGPVVENWPSENPKFLIDSPYKLLAEGNITNPVPWIVGDVKDEGLLLHASVILKNTTLTKQIDKEWLRVAPLTFMYDEIMSPAEQNKTSKAIRDFYFGNASISNATEQNLADVYSDRFFVYPAQKAAKLYAASGAPTYLYIFSYAGEYTNEDDTPGNPKEIVTHGDDIQYLLHATFRPDFRPRSTSAVFTNEYIRLWASVAATGTPVVTWGKGTTWKPISPNASELTWYRIDKDTSMDSGLFERRIQFWDSLDLTKMEESLFRSPVNAAVEVSEDGESFKYGYYSCKIAPVVICLFFFTVAILIVMIRRPHKSKYSVVRL